MADPTVATVVDLPASKKHSYGEVTVHQQPSQNTDLLPKSARLRLARHREAKRKYGSGKKVNVQGIKDKKLKRNLGNFEAKYQDAAIKAKDAEILLENSAGFLETENDLEHTYNARQSEIAAGSGAANAQKRFDLKLDQLGPYVFDYTRNGRQLLIGGRKGHIATMDWRDGTPGCEIQLGETVRDVKWLHNNQFFAVAQKKYTYIYDHNGVEVHCLRKHMDATHLEFLPYHFLLASLSSNGFIKYQDVSTGQLVSEIPTRLGTPTSFTQNSWNAILHAGHQNGTVTLWSPNSQKPHVKLLAHRGPVRSMAVDRSGHYMVSTGQDLRMAVWDIRMLKEVNNYFTRQPGSSVSISDTGLTAVSWGTSTSIWKDLWAKEKPQAPYMSWGGEGKKMERVKWCPFDDVLGLGHDQGFSSILVPGAGEANFDALEANPYETSKQRRETEVKNLLNKLKPEMIALDPSFIGKLDKRSDEQRRAEKDLDGATGGEAIEDEIRNRMRGRNGAMKKYLRKQRKKNIIDDKRLKVEELWKKQQAQNQQRKEVAQVELGPALSRFARKE
ncbi:putative U3 small nucleolar RNA-associated protein 7 [Ceratocystis fimbriata CBS 114723]|uniref:U three protein 7 n=1 Tax=Ceratocystis fimbriata CBS 114723 TaxID=1035309 RepID=A0A2C5WV04_9PEZI|nr:putative U3 small nucleolar RNA-associated protein 7 [Ceratocystis fimbriata CBS 114723]